MPTFSIDVDTCPNWGGTVRLLALLTEPGSVTRLLRHFGEPTVTEPRPALTTQR